MKIAITLVLLVFSINIFAAGKVMINGKDIRTKEDLHTALYKNLDFPKYYGRTLDSLFDVLSTDYSGETIIHLQNVALLKKRLGNDYVEDFFQVIADASEVNPRIVLILE